MTDLRLRAQVAEVVFGMKPEYKRYHPGGNSCGINEPDELYLSGNHPTELPPWEHDLNNAWVVVSRMQMRDTLAFKFAQFVSILQVRQFWAQRPEDVSKLICRAALHVLRPTEYVMELGPTPRTELPS